MAYIVTEGIFLQLSGQVKFSGPRRAIFSVGMSRILTRRLHHIFLAADHHLQTFRLLPRCFTYIFYIYIYTCQYNYRRHVTRQWLVHTLAVSSYYNSLVSHFVFACFFLWGFVLFLFRKRSKEWAGRVSRVAFHDAFYLLNYLATFK